MLSGKRQKCKWLTLLNPAAAQDAVCRGTFQNNPGGELKSSVVLQSALEIASAMAFLHSHGIVHGVRPHVPQPLFQVRPSCMGYSYNAPKPCSVGGSIQGSHKPEP